MIRLLPRSCDHAILWSKEQSLVALSSTEAVFTPNSVEELWHVLATTSFALHGQPECEGH